MKYDDFKARIDEHIARTGRSIVGVGGDRDALPFTYTIGNSLDGKPELLMIGYVGPTGAAILNHISTMDDVAFTDGELVSIGGRFPVKLVKVGAAARSEYAIQAGQYLDNETYPIMQVVAPDTNGVFPDEPGCEYPYSKVPVLRAAG